ncbi:synaptoporin [Asbolus verrucosus]|uniref:Synaptoporin n=1 Tax=Asbolus verrucosus TaxID=1661398 RepID=A0A482VK92_ASBVE|nr:synaptoporin [Asbolus verrucosus]
MNLNISVFREPRGVMRILHFVFSICAFATIAGYTGYVTFKCDGNTDTIKKDFEYPFQLIIPASEIRLPKNCTSSIIGDFSSDAKFFVATGILAMLYSITISVVYIKFDEMYKSNNQFPLIDFVITVIFGVLWLSSSAAWANGLSGLKYATEPQIIGSECHCMTFTSNFSTLNISIFGFLNFFLWAADLWFLYKETAWFQGNQPQTNSGV